MKDFVEVGTFLGIKVRKHSVGYSLNQAHYNEKILNKINHLGFIEINPPFDSSVNKSSI